MNPTAGSQRRADGVTSGTDVRPERDLTAPIVLTLAEEANSMLAEPEWAEGEKNARTIVATDGMRVTLVGLRDGATIGNEASDDTMAVQVLRGAAEVAIGGGATALGEGQLLALTEPRGWELRARGDTLVLLTVALGAGR